MKTHKHLYSLITDFANLYLAFRRPVEKDLGGFCIPSGYV